MWYIFWGDVKMFCLNQFDEMCQNVIAILFQYALYWLQAELALQICVVAVSQFGLTNVAGG